MPVNSLADDEALERERETQTQEIEIEKALALCRRALELHKSRQWSDANAVFDELFELDVLYETFLNNKSSRSLRQLRHLAFKSFALFDLDRLQFHSGNGDKLVARQKTREALENLVEALSFDEDDPLSWRKVAELAQKLGFIRVQKLALESAIAIAHGYPSNGLNIGNPEVFVSKIALDRLDRQILTRRDLASAQNIAKTRNATDVDNDFSQDENLHDSALLNNFELFPILSNKIAQKDEESQPKVTQIELTEKTWNCLVTALSRAMDTYGEESAIPNLFMLQIPSRDDIQNSDSMDIADDSFSLNSSSLGERKNVSFLEVVIDSDENSKDIANAKPRDIPKEDIGISALAQLPSQSNSQDSADNPSNFKRDAEVSELDDQDTRYEVD